MKKFYIPFLLLSSIGLSCCGGKSPASSEGPSSSAEEEDNVAHVIVLLGQSNMEGNSHSSCLKNKISEDKYQEYETGYDDVLMSWIVPWNPTQNSDGFFESVKLGQGAYDDRFGPEIGMAEYFHNNGRKNVFFVKYVWGGTKLDGDWRSPSSGRDAGKLSKGAVKYVLEAMSLLENMDYYPVIDAICWMQGESDVDGAYFTEYNSNYYQLEKWFISDLREDFMYYGHPSGIAFIDAGISTCPYWKFSAQLNADKQRIADEDPLGEYFSTSDLEYRYEPTPGADDAHYDSLASIELGRRFAIKADKYIQRKN